MKIAILSDLHLGCGDRADRFQHDEAAFLRFLDALERWADVVVINGDLYETWQGARWRDPSGALAASRRRYPRLTARLHRPPYLLTWGNHDPLLASTDGVPAWRHLHADGLTLAFTHGQRWDGLLKRLPALPYAFAWTTGWLRRQPPEHPLWGALEARRHAAEVRHLYNPAPPPRLAAPRDAACRYAAGAAAWLRDHPRVHLLALGHTHVAARVQTPWGLYLNSGACAAGRFDWAAIDTRARWAGALQHEPDPCRGLEQLQQHLI